MKIAVKPGKETQYGSALEKKTIELRGRAQMLTQGAEWRPWARPQNSVQYLKKKPRPTINDKDS